MGISHLVRSLMGFPGSSDSKECVCNIGDLGLILGLRRSPGEGNGYPFQYSYLENSIDRGAWQDLELSVLVQPENTTAREREPPPLLLGSLPGTFIQYPTLRREEVATFLS